VNNYTAGRDDIGSLVFGWEQHMPLWPWTIIPYWSIDLLYGLSFLLPRTRQEMDRHALALLTAQLISVAASCSGRCVSPSSGQRWMACSAGCSMC